VLAASIIRAITFYQTAWHNNLEDSHLFYGLFNNAVSSSDYMRADQKYPGQNLL
jgi:hypothetical protein